VTADPLTKLADGELPCPLCGCATEIWQEILVRGDAVKFVSCANNALHDDEPCPFYLPPMRFKLPTRREAVAYFAAFSVAAARSRQAAGAAS
jgi:hypothetical protein